MTFAHDRRVGSRPRGCPERLGSFRVALLARGAALRSEHSDRLAGPTVTRHPTQFSRVLVYKGCAGDVYRGDGEVASLHDGACCPRWLARSSRAGPAGERAWTGPKPATDGARQRSTRAVPLPPGADPGVAAGPQPNRWHRSIDLCHRVDQAVVPATSPLDFGPGAARFARESVSSPRLRARTAQRVVAPDYRGLHPLPSATPRPIMADSEHQDAAVVSVVQTARRFADADLSITRP